jgi:NTP pyrophosphatase (non-canonical NTP hydrolase)
MSDIGYNVPTFTITTEVPESVIHYREGLQKFFAGMAFKLHVNAHKPPPKIEELPTLMLRLMGEVGELIEQLMKDDRSPNAAHEAFDTANFAFLVYLALLTRDNPVKLP